MADSKREIDDLRAEMTKLDAQLLGTLEKRAKASRRLGELRRSQPAALPLGDRAALRSLVERATGDMPQEAVRQIFREVYAACLALELPVKVAYVGPEGGAGHAAARARFGPSSNLMPAESIATALDEITRQRAEFAVVPLETLAEGPVQATIVALTVKELKIVETLDESWNLHLLNRTGNAADVEKVYATAADRALCARFLQSLGAGVAVLDVKSPIVACQTAMEDPGAAALTTDVFGSALGLEVAHRNVLDDGDYKVRYAIVGARPSSRTGSDLTSFVFSVKDAPGALLDVLKQFAERGISLIKIHSRAAQDGDKSEGVGETWSYLFFVEVHGHATDRAIVTAFEEVKRLTRFFKVLGSYPAGA
jgi:chorismate mutase/prephenate dehydratase